MTVVCVHCGSHGFTTHLYIIWYEMYCQKEQTTTYETLSRLFSDEIADARYCFIIFSLAAGDGSARVTTRLCHNQVICVDMGRKKTHLNLFSDEMADVKYRFVDDTESLFSTRMMGLGPVSRAREGESLLILSVRACCATRLDSAFCEPSVSRRHMDELFSVIEMTMTSVART
jgi:hypothetical protein